MPEQQAPICVRTRTEHPVDLYTSFIVPLPITTQTDLSGSHQLEHILLHFLAITGLFSQSAMALHFHQSLLVRNC